MVESPSILPAKLRTCLARPFWTIRSPGIARPDARARPAKSIRRERDCSARSQSTLARALCASSARAWALASAREMAAERGSTLARARATFAKEPRSTKVA